MQPNKRSETEKHRILVVDDNPSIHEDFRKILCPITSNDASELDSLAADLLGEAAGDGGESVFDMDSAFQGQDALEKVRQAEAEQRPYAVVFMDVRMPPGWDGIETVRHIWKDHAYLQVVICTAYSDYSWTDILKKLGDTDSLVILKKPFDNIEVLQLAHTLTRKYSVTREMDTRLRECDELLRQRSRQLAESEHRLRQETARGAILETALRDSEERFQRLFETVPVPVWICRAKDGKIMCLNPALASFSGFDSDELPSRSAEELGLLPVLGLKNFAADNAERHTLNRAIECILRQKDGQVRVARITVRELKFAGESCLLLTAQDVLAELAEFKE